MKTRALSDLIDLEMKMVLKSFFWTVLLSFLNRIRVYLAKAWSSLITKPIPVLSFAFPSRSLMWLSHRHAPPRGSPQQRPKITQRVTSFIKLQHFALREDPNFHHFEDFNWNETNPARKTTTFLKPNTKWPTLQGSLKTPTDHWSLLVLKNWSWSRLFFWDICALAGNGYKSIQVWGNAFREKVAAVLGQS